MAIKPTISIGQMEEVAAVREAAIRIMIMDTIKINIMKMAAKKEIIIVVVKDVAVEIRKMVITRNTTNRKVKMLKNK